ncbi:MAG: aldehyde dehydrogenase family protein, partial [Acinetobacter sp.]
SDLSSDMEPWIDKPNIEHVNGMVEKAISDGAKVIVRGGVVSKTPLSKGAFYRPTLLQVTDPNVDIVQKEVISPVLSMLIFDTEEELANNSEYGFVASIWTQDINCPLHVARKILADTFWINDWAIIYDEFEEGSYKKSDRGCMNGVATMDDFIEYKNITITAGVI